MLCTFNRLMRRSYFRLQCVYAHVQQLPPQTRTHYTYTHTHCRICVVVRSAYGHNELQSQQTYTCIQAIHNMFLFSFNVLSLPGCWFHILFFAPCGTCIGVNEYASRVFLFFLLLLLRRRRQQRLLVVMVGSKQMKKHQINDIHTQHECAQ